MRQYDDRIPVRQVLVGLEHAAQVRPGAEDIEPLDRDAGPLQSFGHFPASVVEVAFAQDGGVGEDLCAVADVREVGGRERNILQAQFVVLRANRDNAVRVRDPRRIQEKLIDEAEDRGVRSDSQRQGGHGSQGKAGALGQGARGKAEVGEHKCLDVITRRRLRRFLKTQAEFLNSTGVERRMFCACIAYTIKEAAFEVAPTYRHRPKT